MLDYLPQWRAKDNDMLHFRFLITFSSIIGYLVLMCVLLVKIQGDPNEMHIFNDNTLGLINNSQGNIIVNNAEYQKAVLNNNTVIEERPCRISQFDPNSHVQQLFDENFHIIVDNSDFVWLVVFFSPFCPHCTAMKPEWEKLGTQMSVEESKYFKVGKVDCTCEKELCKEFSISGIEKDNQEKFSGKRTAENFLQWAEQNSKVYKYENRNFD